MRLKAISFLAAVFLPILLAAPAGALPELCQTIDQKPVLSLQQIRQAELVHYIVVIAGFTPPSPAGKTLEQFYWEEVQILLDNGYPPALAEIEPDRLVTRRYFASVLFQIAVETDPAFAARYGGLTDETSQLRALVESEWLYSETGLLYREEVLSILCTRNIRIEKPVAIDITPVWMSEAVLEVPATTP